MASQDEDAVPSKSPPPSQKKRRRPESSFKELEVNVNASEPLSKKAGRNQKRQKPIVQQGSLRPTTADCTELSKHDDLEEPPQGPRTRSGYGVWIGNLPWTVSKAQLREFFTKADGIRDHNIVRVHLPARKQNSATKGGLQVPQNRGFAYVDLSSQQCLGAALALSETLLSGRRVLIKDAEDFKGRPAVSKSAMLSGNPPNRRIFIGNLNFETTEDELRGHFARCGEIEAAFIATFEDSGNCKGYAWITFVDLASAENAVKGWIDAAEGGQREKTKRHWVHRMHGRQLRVEFAENETVRYQKRFGQKESGEASPAEPHAGRLDGASGRIERTRDSKAPKEWPDEQGHLEQQARSKKPRARTVAESSNPITVHKLTGAMVESRGKKTVFA